MKAYRYRIISYIREYSIKLEKNCLSPKNNHALKIDLHAIHRVDNPYEKSFLAPQGIHCYSGLEIEVDSPLAIYRTIEGNRSKL